MKVNQRIALTKRLLQEALLRILKIKSIDKINVTELCKESGINRATFYRHYNIPRDVLMDLQMQFIEDLQSSFDLSASTRPLSEYLEQLCTHLYNHSDLIKVFIHNNSEDDMVYLLNDIFRKYLEQDTNMNAKHNLDSIELKLISVYIAGGGYFLLRQWLLEDIEKTPTEIAQFVLSFMDTNQFVKMATAKEGNK